MTHSINDTQHKRYSAKQHSVLSAILLSLPSFTVMLNVLMLSVIMLKTISILIILPFNNHGFLPQGPVSYNVLQL
jgi:hypothetical protein